MVDGVDTSSYPKPGTPINPLDVAGKLGSMQSQALQINQQKLSQANEALGYLTRAMSAIGPNGTIDQYKRAGQDAVNAGLVPPNMLGIWNKKADDAKSPQEFYNEAMTAAADHGAIFKYHLGDNERDDSGQRTKLFRRPLSVGSGPFEQGSIPKEIPPTQPQLGPNNESRLTGPQPSPQAPGFNDRFNGMPPNRLGALPPGPINPAAIPGMRPGEKAISAQVQPATGPATGVPPDYEPGLKQFTNDQDLATQKLTAIKPALQAFPLLKDLTTGIGTETYNKALAGLNNLGWLPQDLTDKVEAYQIVNKKLADYLRTNPIGQRSDAAQALSQSASPDPKGLINQALVKVLPDAVALDRAQALRTMGFLDEKGNRRIDYDRYGDHRATFPPKIDERALKLDFMSNEDRNKLIDEMEKKKGTREGKKFLYTYELAEKNGLFER